MFEKTQIDDQSESNGLRLAARDGQLAEAQRAAMAAHAAKYPVFYKRVCGLPFDENGKLVKRAQPEQLAELRCCLDERRRLHPSFRYGYVPPEWVDDSMEAAVRWALGTQLQDRPAVMIFGPICLIGLLVFNIMGIA